MLTIVSFHRFLPMYEYHVNRYLPAHIQLPHNFLKSHMPDMSKFTQYKYNHFGNRHAKSNLRDNSEEEPYLDIPPAYRPHPSHGKHSMTPFIGSIQVRVRYGFQHPPEDPESDTLSPLYFNHKKSTDNFSLLTTSRKSSVYSSSSNASSSTAYQQHQEYHDAVEPKMVLVDDISQILNSPVTPKPNVVLKSESTVDLIFHRKLDNGRKHINLEQYKVDFPKMDGENKKRNAEVSDNSSIKSHNFGDKNFAFRWINESFEEVAISHPSLDRMIGMVVSPQTRILLRAVVKMFNAFGQGFKITILQLLSSLSLLQAFYTDIPRLIIFINQYLHHIQLLFFFFFF